MPAAAALDPTPHQTEGPFFPDVLPADRDMDLIHISGRAERAAGQPVRVVGRVLDPQGEPLSGVDMQMWQANHHGRYWHKRDPSEAPLDPNFQGYGRLRTGADGAYQIDTILPGPYPLAPLGGRGMRCRHLHFKLQHDEAPELTTQMYFAGDPLIEQDGEIAKAPAAQRHLLIAERSGEQDGMEVFRFDLVLRPA